MNWFYAKDGQQAGPVDDAELAGLVQAGVIAGSTLVWHSGLTSWQPYSSLGLGAGGGAVAAVLPGAVSLSKSVDAGQVPCSQCGRVLPADEVVRIGNADVCAQCKPGFIQRLREGVPVYTDSQQFAGFWIRFGAAFLDFLILVPIQVLYGVIVGVFAATHKDMADPQSSTYLVFQVLNLGVGLVLNVLYGAYSGFCVSRYGGTPGKRICKLRIIRGDGGPVTFWHAVGRYLAKIISKLILLGGYLFIAFDDQKRGLHDIICDTRVVHDQR